MFVLALLPMVVWLLLGSSHLAIMKCKLAQPGANFVELRTGEVRRIHLLRTRVNKGYVSRGR
jgi:hypothetical protein